MRLDYRSFIDSVHSCSCTATPQKPFEAVGGISILLRCTCTVEAMILKAFRRKAALLHTDRMDADPLPHPFYSHAT